ncbi:MAG: T9SS type A sorting domain-containing protein [Ignavibacteriae bacterium]|nr:T9SS type A sorting domain-containing protein [Ignavibacteriota bacterium]MCB9219068.1 T9SS type A sorting domain-containing protein [Ignavibacteriales bacterium]MCB9259649.1 T9SS type A sorting domain-containing protein [Ignavibacteriales bacterium]
MFSGDPVKRTGWLSKYESEWRIMNSTGPFNLTVNEPVELIYAIIIGRGNMPLNSVTVVKEYTEEIIKFYESNFTKYPVGLKQKYNSLLPKKYILHQNYPNPFNPSTIIEYSIPNEETFQATAVQLKVYDILGREVTTLFNEVKQPGSYQVTFDASALSSGMYFYELKSGNFREVKKMMLLR